MVIAHVHVIHVKLIIVKNVLVHHAHVVDVAASENF